ncbi:MAG: 30S ribosomal protein S17e [Candidatus Aenigmarchaeota archaeon]|nr:30S ribosomal protein S17e [Candidatus Aenigmarchaeota archaeon]
MGRIKTIPIKSLGDRLLEEHADKFTTDFEKNKKVIDSLKDMTSKKMRNILAGYITKEVQKMKKAGQ